MKRIVMTSENEFCCKDCHRTYNLDEFSKHDARNAFETGYCPICYDKRRNLGSAFKRIQHAIVDAHLSPEQLRKLTDKKFTQRRTGIAYPVLRIGNSDTIIYGKTRYAAKPIMDDEGEVLTLDGQPLYLTNDIYVKNVEPFFAFLDAFKNDKLDKLDDTLKVYKKRAKFTRPMGSDEIANFDVSVYKQKLAELKQNENVDTEEIEQQARLAAQQTTSEELEKQRKVAEESRKVVVQELESKEPIEPEIQAPVIKTNVISNVEPEREETQEEAQVTE